MPCWIIYVFGSGLLCNLFNGNWGFVFFCKKRNQMADNTNKQLPVLFGLGNRIYSPFDNINTFDIYFRHLHSKNKQPQIEKIFSYFGFAFKPWDVSCSVAGLMA